jgi:hypothetical protein
MTRVELAVLVAVFALGTLAESIVVTAPNLFPRMIDLSIATGTPMVAVAAGVAIATRSGLKHS